VNPTVLFLALSQAALMTVTSVVLSSSALIGARLSSMEWATVPLGVQYLATMLLLYPTAKLMERYGRRPIFFTGALMGIIGLAIAAAGIREGNFALFAAAGFLIGTFNAAGQFYRFAAAEAVPTQRKGLAISWTLAGGVVAAMGGPLLARYTKDILHPVFYGSFLALIGVAILGVLFSVGLKIPPMIPLDHREVPRPLREIARDRRFALAVVGGVVGYALMNLIMTATPLAMMDSRLGFGNTATVIQWHVVAMFAPSFITGSIIQSLGSIPVMLLGCLLSLGSIAVSLSGTEPIQFGAALVLLGIGWNFLYVGATSLLTETYRNEEKARIQALNDTLVFMGVTMATLFSGALMKVAGWYRVNLYAALAVILLAAVLLRELRWTRISGARLGPR